jgi:hypothetical protein
MRAFVFIGLLALPWCAAAQPAPTNESGQLALPNSDCRFDRVRVMLRQVQAIAPIDLSAALMKPVRFPIGTVVSVSKQEESWSCVTGSVQKSNGWVTRTGWLQTSLLGSLSPKETGILFK